MHKQRRLKIEDATNISQKKYYFIYGTLQKSTYTQKLAILTAFWYSLSGAFYLSPYMSRL